MLTLGEKLRKLRDEKGVSLQIASTALGIAKSTIVGYEKDNREPNINTINKLAEYYRINTNDLIDPNAVPTYRSIDLKILFKTEDIDIEGKRLTEEEKNMIYNIARAMVGFNDEGWKLPVAETNLINRIVKSIIDRN